MSVNGLDDAFQTVTCQSQDPGERNLHHSVFGNVFDLLISLDCGSNTLEIEKTRTVSETTSTKVSIPHQIETTSSVDSLIDNKSTQPLVKVKSVKSNSLSISKCLETVSRGKRTKRKIAKISNLAQTKKKKFSQRLDRVQSTKNTSPLRIKTAKKVSSQFFKKSELTTNYSATITENTAETQNDSSQLLKNVELTKNYSSTIAENTAETQNDYTQLLEREPPTDKSSSNSGGTLKNQNVAECDKFSFPPKVEDEPETILPDNPKLESLQHLKTDWPFIYDGPENVILLDILDPSKYPLKFTEELAMNSLLQGSLEGESILGGYEDTDVSSITWKMNSDLSNKAANPSPKKKPEGDLDLDMGCYSDASNEEVFRDVTTSNSPDLRGFENEPKNDTDSGCDVQTESVSNQGFSTSDSRVLQISLRRLEEEEWFGNSKAKSSKTTSLINCGMEAENELRTYKSLNRIMMKNRKNRRSRRGPWAKKRKMYRCQTCSKMFPNKALRDKHSKEAKCSRMWKCNICVCQFKDKERLQEHYLSKCDTVNVFECDSCGRKYKLKKFLIDHMTPVCKSKCNVCGLLFKSSASLNHHKISHKKREFVCEFCGKIVYTAYRKTFEAHLLSHSPEGTFTCAECGKSFESLYILKKHLPEHGMIVFSEDFAYHCSFCGRPFVKRECLKEHLAKHTGEMPFACNSCGKKFKTRRYLKEHSNIYHKVKLEINCVPETPEKLDRKPEICQKCFKAFENQETYRDHLCIEDVFNFQSQIIKVENEYKPPPIFEDEKPYVCETCGSAIEGLENIISHVESCVSKPEPDLKPFTKNLLNLISRCGKKFTTRWSVQRHTKTCSLCGGKQKNMCFKNNLIKKEIKPHVCQECGSAFSSSENLKMHLTFCKIKTIDDTMNQMVVKRENVQQVCQKCGSHFSSYMNLKRHFKFCLLRTTIGKGISQKACPYCSKMFNRSYISRHRNICLKQGKVKQESNKKRTQMTSTSPHKISGKICEKCGQFVKYSSNIYRHKKNCKGTPNKPLEIVSDMNGESTLSGNKNTDCPVKVEMHGKEVIDRLAGLFVSNCCISADIIDASLNFYKNDNPKASIDKTTHVPVKTDIMNCIKDADLSNAKSIPELDSFDKIKETILNDLIKLEPVENLEIHESGKSFACKTCEKRFDSEHQLVNHLLFCKINQFICSVCNLKFHNVNNLNKHMAVHDKSFIQTKIPCEKCGKTFAHSKSIRRHHTRCQDKIPVSSNNIQDDKICSVNQAPPNTDDAKPRLEDHPTQTSVLHECNICSKKLSTLRSLKRHLRTVHKNDNFTSSSDQSSFVESTSTNKKIEETNERNVGNISSLDPENSSFVKEALFHKLEERAHNQEDEDSGVSKPIIPDVSMPRVCLDCGKIFYAEGSYKNHLKGKTCRLTLTCILCKDLAASSEQFLQHMLNHGIRIEDKSFYCKSCGKLMEKRKRSIECHLMLHTEDKPHKCDKCTKSFTRKDGLTRHRMLHTGERPFPCNLCKSTFIEKRSLKRHLQIVHKIFENQLFTSSPQSSTSFDPNNSLETNIEIGESHLKTFFDEKPDIKDLLEKNLEALENFEREKVYTVQHEGQLFFYGSLNGPPIQNDTNVDTCQSELLSAVDSISDQFGCQSVESALPLEQW